MQHQITLDADHDAALNALSTESGHTADDLLHSFVVSGLQSRVNAAKINDSARLLDIVKQASSSDTKADMLAAFEASKPK